MAQKSVKREGSASSEIEIEPDAWDRFKRAAHKVASSPPKPHKSASAGGKASSRDVECRRKTLSASCADTACSSELMLSL